VFISCADDYSPDSTGWATGSDFCGDVTITYTDDLPIYNDEDPNRRRNCEEIIRTWVVTDACGNTASCEQKITTKIDLSIVKTFDPTEVPQGTLQSFTIVVSNAGPSDAVDVLVKDLVNTSLDVTNVSVTDGSGDCSLSDGQEVNCTVQIPTGESVTVTVEYLTAPFFDNTGSPYNTVLGDDFYFVFANGSVLEGSTDTGIVLLNGKPADATIITSLTRNDIIFDPPGDDPAFELHLSCSDPFTDGWGQSGGPVEFVDENWQIAFFTVGRYSPQGFLKSCGNVVNDFDIPNTASTEGEDSFGTQDEFDDATVTIGPGITIDRLSTKGKRLTARLNNLTGEEKIIDEISVKWPGSNGNLKKVWITHDKVSNVIWQGNDAPAEAYLGSSAAGWNGGTLFTGEAILRFDFNGKVANFDYTIRVLFTDGTFLDISVTGANRESTAKLIEEPKMSVYPSPAKSSFNVKLEGYSGEFADIVMYDVSGREILRVKKQYFPNKDVRIQLPSSIEEGMYFVQLRNNRSVKSVSVYIRK